MTEFVWQLLTWPIRAGADHLIAALEAAMDDILAMWDEWDRVVA